MLSKKNICTTWLTSNIKAIDSLLKIVSIVAIIAGGWWTYDNFSVERTHRTQVNTEHIVSHIHLKSDDAILLIITLKITNIGKILVKIQNLKLDVQQVLPLFQCIDYKDKECTTDTKKEIKSSIRKRDIKNKNFSWPSIKLIAYNKKTIIEPGESDYIDFEFAISCEVRTVRIQSSIETQDIATDKSEPSLNRASYYELSDYKICHE